MKKRLLILSDAPTSNTGLAKIARELAIRIHQMPEFEVGTYGIGKSTSRVFPFQQYLIPGLNNSMTPPNMVEVCKDFFGNEKGILFTIWNPGWLPWLAYPNILPDGEPFGDLKRYLVTNPFERWGYWPVDAESPNGNLPLEFASIMHPFERSLAYTKWCADMMDRTLGLKEWTSEYLPHGIDTAIYHPRDKMKMRQDFFRKVTKITDNKVDKPVDKDVFLIGVVGTNTPRKDWPTAFGIAKELLKRGVNVLLWAHLDTFKKNWDIPTMTAEYQLRGRIVPTQTSLTDQEMAEAFCACDVTLGIGLGEGFGLPIFESLACGVPCVAYNYGGAAEFLENKYKVTPSDYYVEGFYSHKRPVAKISDWCDKIMAVAGQKATLPIRLEWDNVWEEWEEWLRKGLE